MHISDLYVCNRIQVRDCIPAFLVRIAAISRMRDASRQPSSCRKLEVNRFPTGTDQLTSLHPPFWTWHLVKQMADPIVVTLSICLTLTQWDRSLHGVIVLPRNGLPKAVWSERLLLMRPISLGPTFFQKGTPSLFHPSQTPPCF